MNVDNRMNLGSIDSDNPCDRRAFLRIVAAASVPFVANACDGGDLTHSDGFVQFRGVNPSANVAISTLQAKNSQAIVEKQEHLSIDSELMAHLAIGDQCRIRRANGNVALYTVGEVRSEVGINRIRMGMEARARLGTTETFDAMLQTKIVADLSDAQAQAQSEFVERLVDDGVSSGLVAIAPHGGAIEEHTDDQAVLVQSLLAGKGASSWICKGYKQGGGAYDRWHITSTDLSRKSFPGLDAIADRGFEYAVSFHGLSHDLVLIGGSAPFPVKQLIQSAILGVLHGSGIDVAITNPDDLYSGDSPANVVNWLTADGLGGIQIEQSLQARNLFALDIAAAVAGVFDLLI